MADDVPGTKKVPCSTQIPFVLQVNLNFVSLFQRKQFALDSLLTVLFVSIVDYYGVCRNGPVALLDRIFMLETKSTVGIQVQSFGKTAINAVQQ